MKTNHLISYKYPATRITVYLFFILFCTSTFIKAQKINLIRKNVPLTNVIEEIEKQSQMTIGYSESIIDPTLRVSVTIVDKPIEKAMEELLQGTNTTFRIQGRQILLIAREQASEPSIRKTVSGIVSDEKGEPIIGANVIEKGTTNGVITDLDGRFSLSVTPGATFEISYIGYISQGMPVGNQSTLHVVLKEDSQALEEVVVIGYSVQKKKLVTGATVQIKGEEMEKLSATNPITAMQSSTPGLQITQNNGSPGSGYKVYIRGIGTLGDSAPLVIIDGFIGGDLGSLNPGDIESVDVLKDAASGAIYGARAANGVIIVTTKKGKAGKTQVSYDGYFGIQDVPKMLHTADALTYAGLLDEIQDYDNLPHFDYAALVPNWDDIQSGKFKGTDWLELSRNKRAPTQNHSINITGGTEMSTYSIGFSYMSQEAVLGEPKVLDYSRYTARINSDHVLLKKDGLNVIKFGENILLNDQVRQGPEGRLSLRTIVSAPPFLPVKDKEGNYSSTTLWTSQYYPNPYAHHDLGSGEQKSNRLSLHANAFLEIQPIKDLIFRSSYTFDFSHKSKQAYYPTYNLGGDMQRTDEQIDQEQGFSMGHILENTLNYNFSIDVDKGSHKFDALLGQSIQAEGLGSNISGSNIDPIMGGLDYAYLDNAQQIISGKTKLGGYPNIRHQIASFFGRVNYNFNETYLASVILRADASSNFARGNRWGYFPSVSAGWVISNEKFMKNTSSWLDFFKLRASWGQNGNEGIPNFQYLSTVSFNSNYYFGGTKDSQTSGAYYDILPNNDISWETSEQFDLGFDSRLLNSRLGVNFDYYVKNTKDWLVQAPSLSSNGTGTPYINGGDIQNRGVELAFTWNDNIGKLQYGINVNGSYNRNEVTRIANGQGIIYGSTGGDLYRAQVGYPVSYFLGYKSAGIFQNQEQIDNWTGPKLKGVKPGDIIWVDTNNDKKLNTDDRVQIGNPHPKFRFGLGFNLAYKGFDFLFSGYGSAGVDIYQSYRSWPDLPLVNFTSNYIDRRWHGEGTSTTIPRFTGAGHTNWTWNSTQFIEDGSYFRIDNITLGYDFNKLIKSSPLNQLRLYVTAQNLYTITGYTGMDPEIGYSGESWGQGLDYMEVPRPRTFLVGVNIKF